MKSIRRQIAKRMKRLFKRKSKVKLDCLPTEILLIIVTRDSFSRWHLCDLALVSTRFHCLVTPLLFSQVEWTRRTSSKPLPVRCLPFVRSLTLDLGFLGHDFDISVVQDLLQNLPSLSNLFLRSAPLQILLHILPIVDKISSLVALRFLNDKHDDGPFPIPEVINAHIETLELCSWSSDPPYILFRSLLPHYIGRLRILEIDGRLIDLPLISLLSSSHLRTLTFDGWPPTIDSSRILHGISKIRSLQNLAIWFREAKIEGAPFILASRTAEIPLALTTFKMSNLKPEDHILSYLGADTTSVTLLHNPRQTLISDELCYAAPTSTQLLEMLQSSKLGISLVELRFAVHGEIDCQLLRFISEHRGIGDTTLLVRWSNSISRN